MMLDSNSALVDNDFINHCTEIKISENDILRIMRAVFSELGVIPYIHPLIYKHELRDDILLPQKIIDLEIIKKADFSDIHGNDTIKKTYYEILVKELHKKLTGYSDELDDKDIFSYWKRKISLGEVHCAATCLMCNCSMFLSDDTDSKSLKKIIDSSFPKTIEVYNRDEVMQLLKERGTTLPRNELRKFAHK